MAPGTHYRIINITKWQHALHYRQALKVVMESENWWVKLVRSKYNFDYIEAS